MINKKYLLIIFFSTVVFCCATTSVNAVYNVTLTDNRYAMNPVASNWYSMPGQGDCNASATLYSGNYTNIFNYIKSYNNQIYVYDDWGTFCKLANNYIYVWPRPAYAVGAAIINANGSLTQIANGGSVTNCSKVIFKIKRAGTFVRTPPLYTSPNYESQTPIDWTTDGWPNPTKICEAEDLSESYVNTGNCAVSDYYYFTVAAKIPTSPITLASVSGLTSCSVGVGSALTADTDGGYYVICYQTASNASITVTTGNTYLALYGHERTHRNWGYCGCYSGGVSVACNAQDSACNPWNGPCVGCYYTNLVAREQINIPSQSITYTTTSTVPPASTACVQTSSRTLPTTLCGTNFTPSSAVTFNSSNNTWSWNCKANIATCCQTGDIPCSATKIIDGVCGVANGISANVKPLENLCAVGTASAVTGGNTQIPLTYWSWTCAGTNGGTPASCSAPVPGQCGLANGKIMTTEPTAGPDLCLAGTASAVSGTGPWTWTCTGASKDPLDFTVRTGEDAPRVSPAVCSANKITPPTVTIPPPTNSNTHNYCNESSYENLLWTYVDTNTPKSPQIGYDLQVSMDDDFPNDNLQINILKPSAPHPGSSFYQATVALGAGGSGVLSPDTTYYWHVKVYSSNGESNWSTTQSFTTPPHPYPTINSISSSPQNPYIKNQVTFTAIAEPGDESGTQSDLHYAWTDKDGNSVGTDSNVYRVTFDTMGSKTVNVEVCEEHGVNELCCSKSKTIYVRNSQSLPIWLEVSPL